ncbi:MAG: hypothetical protein AAF372_04935, partial [Pseudomonadota bacterium]
GITLNQSITQFSENPISSLERVESRLEQIMNTYEDLSKFDVYTCAPSAVNNLLNEICISKKLFPARFFKEPLRGNNDMSCLMGIMKQRSERG